MNAATKKVVNRIRAMLIRRAKRAESNAKLSAELGDFERAAAWQREMHGVAWSIHDLDLVVEETRKLKAK